MPQHTKIADEYATWLRSWSPSAKTISARRSLAINRLRAWGVEGMTAQNIQAWLGHDPAWSAWTRATYYSHLVDFCSWLVTAGYLDRNPMAEVRKPKRPSSLPRPLAESDVERVLAAAYGPTRDWITIALLTGLRVHEIAKIRGEDVGRDVIYVEGKGGTRADLPTHPDLWEMAQRYPRRGYWFPGDDDGHIESYRITVAVSALFRSLNIEGSIHRCRHTYGTRLLRAGVNIRIVQKLMRHASLATTAAYTAVDEDEMRAAILRLTA